MYSYKILQNWSKDLFHSSIITFEKKSYLFNCSDGTQRNLSHQNIKFNKISHVFYNSSSIDAYLGSYGFSMSRNEQLGPIQVSEGKGKNAEGETSAKKNIHKKGKNLQSNNDTGNEQAGLPKDYKIKSYLTPLMEEANKPLYFWGPPGLRPRFDHCKYFFIERVKDYIYEYNPEMNRFELKLMSKYTFNNEHENRPNSKIGENGSVDLNLNEADSYLDHFEDENLKIYPIISAASVINSAKNNSNNSNSACKTDYALSYYCEPHLRQRTFLPEKAKALGLKPGPNYSALQSGKSVFLEGKEIKPQDVLGEQLPSSCFAVLYSPNLIHSQNLLKNLKSKNFFEKQENKNITLIVHILGDAEILKSEEYKNFISEISQNHKDVMHIIDCKDTNYKFMLNEEKHKMKYLLSKADSKCYNNGFIEELNTKPDRSLEGFISHFPYKENIINSNCGFEYNLYPIHKKGVLNNKLYEPYLFDKRNAKFHSFIKNADKLISEHINSEHWDFDFNQQKNKEAENQEILNNLNQRNAIDILNVSNKMKEPIPNNNNDCEMKIAEEEALEAGKFF